MLREQDLSMVHFINNTMLTTHKKDLFVRGVLYEDVAAFVYHSDVSRTGIKPVLHIVFLSGAGHVCKGSITVDLLFKTVFVSYAHIFGYPNGVRFDKELTEYIFQYSTAHDKDEACDKFVSDTLKSAGVLFAKEFMNELVSLCVHVG